MYYSTLQLPDSFKAVKTPILTVLQIAEDCQYSIYHLLYSKWIQFHKHIYFVHEELRFFSQKHLLEYLML